MSKIINIKDIKKQSVNQPASVQASTENRETWAGLSEDEAKRPGAGLLAMLYMKANEDGLLLKELASALGVTYPKFLCYPAPEAKQGGCKPRDEGGFGLDAMILSTM